MPKQVMSATMNIDSNTNVAVLSNFLSKFPTNAKVSVSSYAADRPWEMGYSIIKVSWSEEL